MSNVVIKVEHLSKLYRLGQIGTGTLTYDLKVWWAKKQGKSNPLLKIGQTELANRDGDILWALRDISFQVQQGEVLGVIGRNGAGKSTLLKILSRVTAPTSGNVKVKGRIASLLEVGTGFHPELTGRENVFLNGAILGMTRQEVLRMFDEIVAFAEIEKFIDTPVKRYSSGMYVRLAFSVAAFLEAQILVVDEVLAVGDAEFQKKCLGKMGEVAKGGRTVLYVSHNMATIMNLCNNCLLLNKGEILLYDQTEKTVLEYLTWNAQQTKVISKYISEFRICDSQKKDKKIFSIGEKIMFSLKLTNSDKTISAVSIGINNSFSQRITTLHSRYSGFTFSSPSTIFCTLEGLNLSPGQYGLTIAVGSTYEQIEALTVNNSFEIITSDFWGTGRLPSPTQGVVIGTHSWSEETDV